MRPASTGIRATARLDLRMITEEKAKLRIRQLIWLYFWLLIVEGALRKWVIPEYSNPLLVIRDPVMLAIYYYSISGRVFPKNAWVISLWVIGICSALAMLLSPIFPYFSWTQLAEVVVYGFRTNFLHLPIIFVMAKVLDHEDVKKFGWWILVLMVPMSLVMAAQFKASPDSFINRTVGLGEGEQLTAGGGKIRPPGTFSFISGPVFYISVAAAFVIYGAVTRAVYKNWLLIISGVALVVGIIVSGSRACVVSVLIVALTIAVALVFRRQAVNRFGRVLVIVVIGALIITRLPIFKEGSGILSDRFTQSAEAADTTITKGLITRVFEDMTLGLSNIDKYPLFGYGLGIGTNVGARVLVGRAAFIVGESEWQRVLGENGAIFGLAFLLWRTLFTLQLGRLSFRALRRGDLLPILMFSSAFILILTGQLGQPTTLGFATLLNGLCLAAMRPRVDDSKTSASPALAQPGPRPLPRRSTYANRLHGSKIGAEHDNGSADR